MSSKKKLFLLDAFALIYRAHFAFSKNPRITSFGLNTSAVFGFTNSLLEIIQKETPTHIGVAFDTPKPTFRHVAFEAYKANRQEQPEDIRTAIPYVYKLLQSFRIPALYLDGYEADDVIGTIANKAAKQGFEVYMLTMDKDYSQLVTEQVFLYKPSYMGNGHEVYDIPKVLEKFKISRVDQVRDILGLMGDAVDNIPGIPGIGEKTAQKLIAEFDTVENLVANAELLKGKLKENVITFGAQGILSKELATINTDVPIDLEEEALLYKTPDKDAVSSLFDELEFRTMKKRVIGDDSSESHSTITSTNTAKNTETGQMDLFSAGQNQPEEDLTNSDAGVSKEFDSIATVVTDYYIIDTAEKRAILTTSLSKQKEFCFDTETTGIDALEATLVGLSFSWRKGEGYYVPVFADDFAKTKEILNEFSAVLASEQIMKIGQNLKYDILVLKKYDIAVKGPLFDTMLAHYLIEPDMRHNMDALAEAYLNYTCISIEELIGKKGAKQKNMKDLPIEQVATYAIEDADITFQLKNIFAAKLTEANAIKLFSEVEVPLIQVLSNMEIAGINLDVSGLSDYSNFLQEEIVQVEKAIYQKAGYNFNIASPKQLGELLFDRLRLDPKAKKTKTGQYATGEEILSKMAAEHEIARDILDFRELQKLKSTYVDALPTLISNKDKRIHTSYNQAVAATGRLSSTNKFAKYTYQNCSWQGNQKSICCQRPKPFNTFGRL